MTSSAPRLRSVVVPAAMATAASVVALALVARLERKAALRPLNATSHWLHGEAAAAVGNLYGAHTGVGLATHAAATLFWTVPFAWWVRGRRTDGARPMVAAAVAVSAIAALIDYRATPKRFTPGWEFVLENRSMAGDAAGGAIAARTDRSGTGRRGNDA